MGIVQILRATVSFGVFQKLHVHQLQLATMVQQILDKRKYSVTHFDLIKIPCVDYGQSCDIQECNYCEKNYLSVE